MPMRRTFFIISALCFSVSATAVTSVQQTLNNGLKVVVVEDALAPIVSVQLNYLVGSSEAPTSQPGMAHAIEHMMFRGSKGLSKDQLSAITANMGGQSSAFTGQDKTTYCFTVPKQDLPLVLRIEANRMANLTLADSDWQLERKAMMQELAQDAVLPQFQLGDMPMKLLFPHSPYENFPIGTSKGLSSITDKELQHFYQQWYGPNNALLVIAGDVNAAQVMTQVKQYFSPLKPSKLPYSPTKVAQIVAQSMPATGELSFPGRVGKYAVDLVYRLPGQQTADFLTARLLWMALNDKNGPIGGLTMRSGIQLSEAFSSEHLFGSLGFISATTSDSQQLDALKQTLLQVLNQVRTQGVSEALVNIAKRQWLLELAKQQASIPGMAQTWSSALVEFAAKSPEALKQQIVSVTTADVNRFAASLFNSAIPVTVKLSPDAPLQAQAPVSSASADTPEHLLATPTSEIALPAWASNAFQQLPAFHSHLHPVDMFLANGLHLIVQPETGSDVVHLLGKIDANQQLELPENQQGTELLMLQYMDMAGSTSHSDAALTTAINALPATVTVGQDFSATAMSQDFDQAVALLAEKQLRPNFANQPLFGALQRYYQQVGANLMHSAALRFKLDYLSALYPRNDPAVRIFSPDNFANMTLASMNAYFKQAYRPDMTTIVIAGNITAEHAKAIINQYFGDWHAQGNKPVVDFPAVPQNQPSTVNLKVTNAQQSIVHLVETLPLTQSSPERYALILGNSLLSGGFYSARLIKKLREETGLVYSLTSNAELLTHRARWEVEFATDPKNVAQAIALTKQELAKIQQTPVSAQELHTVKSMELIKLSLQEADITDIAQHLLDLAVTGEPLDQSAITANAYRQLTAKDIQQVFAKNIRPEGFITAVTIPR